MLTPFHTKVTVQRQGEVIGEDAHGNDIYSPPVTLTFWGDIQPLSSDERTQDNLTVTQYRVYLPANASMVSAVDALTINGRPFAIIGEPEPHTVSGAVHHYEARVKHIGL